MGLSVGLDIATRALRAQQLAVDVTSHNIANANTPGFSRQEVQLTAEVLPGGSSVNRNTALGQAGLGVNASTVRRLRDLFVDFQIYTVLQDLGRFDAEARALEQAEIIFNEPSDNSLNALFGTFWNSWRDLSNQPASSAARANVLAESQTLTAAIQRTFSQLRTLQKDLDVEVANTVSQVNTLATEVANLNEQITRITITGNNASDLEDRRNLALDALSRLVNVTITKTADNSVSVLVGGRELVISNRANGLAAQADPANNGYKAVRWAADNSIAEITSGELYGHLQGRDVTVAQRVTDLNTLVGAVITQVNTVHSSGFGLDNSTGLAFFTGTTAADVSVNAVIAADTNKIATASAANAPGDPTAALAMADLQHALIMNGGTATFADFYGGTIAAMGVDIREARSNAANQQFLHEHLDTLRDSVAGVSLDEEMTSLIKFQRAFEAAAQLISVVDSMLDTLVNRVGLAGR